jgi:hypothetical protein
MTSSSAPQQGFRNVYSGAPNAYMAFPSSWLPMRWLQGPRRPTVTGNKSTWKTRCLHTRPWPLASVQNDPGHAVQLPGRRSQKQVFEAQKRHGTPRRLLPWLPLPALPASPIPRPARSPSSPPAASHPPDPSAVLLGAHVLLWWPASPPPPPCGHAVGTRTSICPGKASAAGSSGT